ncbi:MAG: DUF3305 domain-containing protein [Alphaproteobacteria bacterium]|nr:DUF3305 domain-containing protein [Alphaproteobacteria bacterium]NNF24933.1 DUF3305 domain-containing protein [Paracoccaceae bacterium]
MPLGIVFRREPGATRWAAWHWRAVAVIPGAPPANWKVLRQHGDATEYHAATLTLELHATEAEAYRVALSMEVPSVYVMMREAEEDGIAPFEVIGVTASPYLAEDYTCSGDQTVEKVAMPEGLVAWVQAFTDAHFKEEVFIKRQRDKQRRDLVEDGIGDPRISQLTDVYRAPTRRRAAP